MTQDPNKKASIRSYTCLFVYLMLRSTRLITYGDPWSPKLDMREDPGSTQTLMWGDYGSIQILMCGDLGSKQINTRGHFVFPGPLQNYPWYLSLQCHPWHPSLYMYVCCRPLNKYFTELDHKLRIWSN